MTEIKIGNFNDLTIVKEVDFGLYLDGGEPWGEILLPRRYMPKRYAVGETLNVFIYTDSEDRIIATTETPKAKVGEFACLKVVYVTPIGAFLDWGLTKDLLMPLGEQKREVQVGETCIVAVYLDVETNRVAASARLSQFMNQTPAAYETGEAVSLLICNKTELGYRAIINSAHWGVIFESDVFEPLKVGSTKRGYIKRVREDGKIDLILHKPGYEKVDDFSELVLEKLQAEGGFLALTDKTEPELIYEMFGVSKKTFKKAVGALYKKRRIVIEENGIRLIDGDMLPEEGQT